ncbi:hypothetical protein RDABS01_007099 [Bienertia sinuspersici]
MKLSSIAHRLISGKSELFRRLTTAASSAPLPETSTRSIRGRNFNTHHLYKRLSAVGTTGEKISDVLHQMMQNGQQFTPADLIICIKDLRRYGRYHHCLEILEWMDDCKHRYSYTDYALRLNIMCNVKGIDEVVKFFDSIPPDFKNHHTYGALLNCYCTNMMTDEAFALFRKMDELNYASNALAYNNLMGLCIKVGTPEKVPSLVEEMKKRNIPLSNYTYCIWIQSYQNAADLHCVEQIVQEVEEQDSLKEDWSIYSNLVLVYTKFGQHEKAINACNKVAELLDKAKNPDRKGYHYLIRGYANLGKLECVYQTWNKLKARYEVCLNTSYLNMLQALSKLDDIEGLKKCLKEWESSFVNYDDRLPNAVIIAYLRHDMLEEAMELLEDVKANASDNVRRAHVIFMDYYLEKHQFDSALQHLEGAIAAKWKPPAKKVEPFFQHFIEEKDVDSAEEFCGKLEKVEALDSETYLWLLQTYAAAGRTAPDMRQRMKENGVSISPEHEELFQKIC